MGGETAHHVAAALRGHGLPAAAVDLTALDHNLALLLAPAMAANKRVRLATKSVRCLALVERVLDHDRVDGLMTFTARETLHWAERLATTGRHPRADLLLGYPIAGPHDATLLATANRHVSSAAMVDDPAQLGWLGDAARVAGVRLPVWIDLDMGWRPVAGVHVGVRRSPVRTVADVDALVTQIRAQPHLQLAGVMGYEAHVAGLPDDGRLATWQNPIKRWLKRRSWPDIVARRGAVVAHLRQLVTDLRCNGGGSGSVDTTAHDPAVTELTIGSGLLAGHLFDGYRSLAFQPSLYFALPVTRVPVPGLVTCAGGGWIASGSVGADRWPLPVWPLGLRLTELEGAGEVQTPLHVPRDVALGVGDLVLFRPAKSGELGEVFGTYTLVRAGEVVDQVPTYKGQGWHAWG